jgi:Aminoglycoside-2''-adenylyltransferase
LTADSFEPDLSLWEAWHPAEATRRLAGVDVPWYVTAGWALDLFRGRKTREHEDLEIAIPERAFGAVRAALSDLELFVIGDGLAKPVRDETLREHHQTWVREAGSGKWRLDIMREPWEGDTWVCRRDARIRLTGSDVIARTADGIPYAQPEIVLLFKAKAVREKDQRDFDGVLPLLGPNRRHWLAGALDVVHPGHRWLAALGR